MAYFDASLFSAGRKRPFAALRGLLDTPFDRRSRDVARQIAELRGLSDAELAERGLSRADIPRHVLLKR